ncbi:ATP-binding cassette domain-containing protein [Mycolicibacterium sp. CBMA 295]|uniref:branched-chain amino acid ABC transporter ATP-binding protein/permease n=1 Tax=Mycolicibacterium sp. CBMA 295 TaxID=2606605 RepID=UPI0012DEB346|nr:branched-chain amino acid ABC transporter ATP-binding protein/permease [Mycolicibacterium sp. CBMA 295]MUM27807.1 branched-chain amino acid ABC transporter ATP-binding protein/permease [Mycolicibacterium sp. CBMA 295]
MAAAAIGVRVGRQRIIGWLLGAALSGMAGGLLGQFLGAFSPKQFYFTMTMTIIAMMVVGGMNTVTGAILGAGVVTVMVNVLRGLEGGGQIAGVSVPQFFGLTDAGLALVLLLTMIIRPQGIVPHFEIDEWLGRLLTRRRPAAEPSPIDWTRLSSEQPVKLEFSEIRKAFAGVQALDGVSFSLCSGEIVGLIGANGSGKSTLVNVVTGVTGMDSGAVRLDGQELAGLSSAEIARRGLARTFQNIRLFSGLTVQDNVAVAAVASGQDWDLGLVLTSDEQLLGLRDRLATTLSYGDQRRVEIARTLATRPKFALLDEPAAGMNVEESEALAERLRQLVEQTGIGILIVDHDMRMMARLCDRLVVLDHGSLITHGHPTEVLTDPRVAELYLGSAAQGLVDERMKTTSNPSKED